MGKVRLFSAAAWFVTLSSGTVQGQVLFSGDFAAGTGQMQLVNDYTFTLSSPVASGNSIVMVFDEAVTTPDSQTFVTSKPGTPFGLEMGGSSYTASFTFVDNLATTSGALTPKDAYTFWSMPASVASGETLTVKAGTYTLNASAAINPEFNAKSFSGSMFLANGSGARLSGDVSAVPEPRDYALLTGIGLIGFALSRRRRKAASGARI